MKKLDKRSAPLKICFWCICPRTGEWRYGFTAEEGEKRSLFVDAALTEGDNLEMSINTILDPTNADIDFVLNCDYLNGYSSIGWLTRVHFAYCQIDLSKYAIERENRQLPPFDFFTLEVLQSKAGLGEWSRQFDLPLLGEVKLIEAYPPKIPTN